MYKPTRSERSPGTRLIFAVLAAAMLVVPLFTVYLLVYDRQSQSTTARASIAEGWGGAQTISGPLLVIPYWEDTTHVETEGGKRIEKTDRLWRELVLSPQAATLDTAMRPQLRHRSIYDVVVYEARNRGTARYAMPTDLARIHVPADHLAFDRAELRFGISDARGLFGVPPRVIADGKPLTLETGRGSNGGGGGFHSFLDASSLPAKPIAIAFDYALRGNEMLSIAPQAGDTRWTVTSSWQHPSFQGDFLPATHAESDKGFTATWRVGNLALGRALVAIGDDTVAPAAEAAERQTLATASVDLVTPVDLYDQVNRSVKYGFLFIGFTFCAFLMFDVIGGVRVSVVEYLLVGAGLVLFFVMLLAFAEVIGFALAYLVAAGAIISLLTAYSGSVLKSWGRAGVIAALLSGLYTVLYVLLSLEAYSLLIGSVLLFVALAAVMFLTRHVDWGGREEEEEA